MMGECTADALDAAIARAQVYARLLRAHEEGTLDLAEEIVAVLEGHREGLLDTLEWDRRSLAKLRTGDADHCYIDRTAAESEQTALGQIDSMLDRLTGCDSLLGRVRAA